MRQKTDHQDENLSRQHWLLILQAGGSYAEWDGFWGGMSDLSVHAR